MKKKAKKITKIEKQIAKRMGEALCVCYKCERARLRDWHARVEEGVPFLLSPAQTPRRKLIREILSYLQVRRDRVPFDLLWVVHGLASYQDLIAASMLKGMIRERTKWIKGGQKFLPVEETNVLKECQ